MARFGLKVRLTADVAAGQGAFGEGWWSRGELNP